ncbi:MAG: hypothetical protein HQ559_01815 [Lentisphaerae bacterium]|nr:hypothetical protein [Lentisphaerota bacterium]
MIAAIRRRKDDKVWSLPRPARHGDVIGAVYDEVGGPVGDRYEQGFVTDDGRFVGRREAFLIARHAGQIVNDEAHDILFTEDLW